MLFSSAVTEPAVKENDSDEKAKWGGEYKLTLLDKALKIQKTSAAIADNKMTVGYSITNSDNTTADGVSLLITKGEYNASGAEVVSYQT